MHRCDRGSSPVSDDPFRSVYEGTRYLVHYAGATIDARIGVRNAELDRLLAAEGAASGVFITAMNPRSEPRTAAENAAANQQLADALQLWKALPHDGIAPDDSWAETGFFVLDLPREEAIVLARRFGQNAIVWCARGLAPALLFSAEEADGGPD
jgi:hypothetical protein